MVIIVAWYTTNLLFSIQQICFIIVVDEVKEETITTIIIIWEAAIEFGHRFEVFLWRIMGKLLASIDIVAGLGGFVVKQAPLVLAMAVAQTSFRGAIEHFVGK